MLLFHNPRSAPLRSARSPSLVTGFDEARYSWPVRIKDGVDEGRSSGRREERGPESEHPAGGDEVFNDRHAAVARVEAHVLKRRK